MLLFQNKSWLLRLRKWQSDRAEENKVVPPYRSLSTEELAITLWLLEHAVPQQNAYKHQLSVAIVNGQCGCGCPTIRILIPHESPAGNVLKPVVATAIGLVNNSWVSVMLLQSQGHLSTLDIHGLEPIDRPFGLPSLDSLKPYWRL